MVVIATPNGLCASKTISPVSSGYTSVIVKTEVPSSKFSIWKSFDEIISVPCLNHLSSGLGLPIALTSSL